MKKINFGKFKDSILSAFPKKRPVAPNGIIPMAGIVPMGGSDIIIAPSPSINWDKIYRKSFLYNSLALIACAYFVADFTVRAISPFLPAGEPPRPRQNIKKDQNRLAAYDPIYTRNLFNEKGLIPNADDMKVGYEGPPVRTSLPINLLGVIVVQDNLKSVASVEDKGLNQVKAVKVNDAIVANTQVQLIEANRVVFINRNTERREFVELPQDAASNLRKAPSKGSAGAGIVNSGNNRFLLDRAEVDKTLGNLNEILTQARCVPNFEAGRPDGYKCFQIVPGSIYEKLGMKNDDVICGINGEPINDPTKAFGFLTELKSAPSIQICIKRNGQVMNFNYDIH